MARTPSYFNVRTNPAGFTRSMASPPSLSNNYSTFSMPQKQTYWVKIEADIESHLKKSIPIRSPLEVFEPMNYLTFAAPKSTAPALCIAACEAVGGQREEAMAAAAAIQLIHAAAYTHQNLPLTDRAKSMTQIDHKFDPNIELMTGDGIIPFGFELLAQSLASGPNNPDKILRVIVEIAKAAGSNGIVDGQYRELETEKDIGLIEYVAKKKEGELYACGAACGAILGGGSEEEIENLRSFGLYAGMIQGLLFGVGRNQKGVQELVADLKSLAMKELKSFKSSQIESISSLVQELGSSQVEEQVIPQVGGSRSFIGCIYRDA